jgi:hypothetical protein
MNIKQGEMFRNSIIGVDFIVKKVVRNMVTLESRDGERQVLREIHSTNTTLFRKGRRRIMKQDTRLPFLPIRFLSFVQHNLM